MTANLCYRCMHTLPVPGGVCPHCGYDNTNDPLKQPSHVLPCGTVLENRYVIGRSLGQGGFGITYIGFDLKLELRVCIKEYYPEGAAMRSSTQSSTVYWGTSVNSQELKDSRQSFVKEARKAVKLRDFGHVVTVWDVFYANETAYIVMDYVEGETLKSHLYKTGKPLSERECFDLLSPVIRDLDGVHALGIIHRDIKPDNLMLRSDGRLVLLDLGAAKDLRGVSQSGMVSSMMVVSQGFSPIEQYSRSGSIGPWTDVYAMCATMVYCLTGKLVPPPIERIGGQTVDLSALSPKLRAVLEKGLGIKPEERIRTMAELNEALTAALGVQTEVKKTPPVKWLIPVLAAAVLCLGVAAYFFISSVQGQPKEIVRTLEKANTVDEVLHAADSLSGDESKALEQLTDAVSEGASIRSDDSNYYVLSFANSTDYSFEDVSFKIIFYDNAGSILYSSNSSAGIWEKDQKVSQRLYASSSNVASARLRVQYDYNGKRFETEYLDIPLDSSDNAPITVVLKKALPATFSSKTYNGNFKYEISSFAYDFSYYNGDYTLTLRFGGKVVSADVERSNYSGMSYKLVDSAGTVYSTGTVSFPALKSGERFENVTQYVSKLPEGTYYLQLSDYSN